MNVMNNGVISVMRNVNIIQNAGYRHVMIVVIVVVTVLIIVGIMKIGIEEIHAVIVNGITGVMKLTVNMN